MFSTNSHPALLNPTPATRKRSVLKLDLLCRLQMPTLKKKFFENIVRKGENAGNYHLSFSQNVFYQFSPRPTQPHTRPQKKSVLKLNLLCRLQMLSICASLKIRHLVMLRLHYVPGGHGNHVSGHRGQNVMYARQRRGTG